VGTQCSATKQLHTRFNRGRHTANNPANKYNCNNHIGTTQLKLSSMFLNLNRSSSVHSGILPPPHRQTICTIYADGCWYKYQQTSRRLLPMTSKLMVTIKVGHLHFREASNTSALSFAKVLIQGNLQGWVRLKWIINNSDLNATKSHNTMPLIKNIYAANKLQGSGLFDAVVVHNKTSYQVDSDITMGIWRELIRSNI